MDPRAMRCQLLDFTTIPTRAFHLTWMAFFVCFFAWFAVAPLMPAIRADLGLTRPWLDTDVRLRVEGDDPDQCDVRGRIRYSSPGYIDRGRRL
jgi:hypothetical protein